MRMFDSTAVARYILYPHGELCKKVKYALQHASVNARHFRWKTIPFGRGNLSEDTAYGYDVSLIGLYILMTMFRRQDFREKMQEYIELAESEETESGTATS